MSRGCSFLLFLKHKCLVTLISLMYQSPVKTNNLIRNVTKFYCSKYIWLNFSTHIHFVLTKNPDKKSHTSNF